MKVLSLDLDYITGPYGNFINKICRSRYVDKPNGYWEDISINFGDILGDLKINYGNLNYFFEVFTKAIASSNKVLFSYYHDCILSEIKDINNLEITNVDMHHDIFYTEDHVYAVEKLKTCDECNWVWYLNILNRLKSYTWIRDKNSFFPNDQFLRLEVPFYYKFTTKEEYKIEDYNFDLVFVCLSPQYIVPQHWHYFDILKVVYKSITGEDPIFYNARFDQEFDITKNESGLIL